MNLLKHINKDDGGKSCLVVNIVESSKAHTFIQSQKS
jgi:hypothetical protein